MACVLTSAGGIISLLDEKEPELQIYALERLNDDSLIRQFWAEIADSLEPIEILYEDESFAARKLAALVASKVYFNLGSYSDSLNFALAADEMFDVTERSEYVQVIISSAIETYKEQRKNGEIPEKRLESMVNRMFTKCLDSKTLRQVIGIAIECRRFDVVETAIAQSPNTNDTLAYCMHIAKNLVTSRELRKEILRLLVAQYTKLATPDYIAICQCLVFLDDPSMVSDTLRNLLAKDALMAYQIGFELYQNAPQGFLNKVAEFLRGVAPAAAPADASAEAAEGEAAPAPASAEKSSSDKLVEILKGDKTTQLNLQFLIRNNKSDLLILKHCKDSCRNTICHTATVIANSFMHSGTTTDKFLRDNLEWLGRATNWAKFTATSSLGVIHKGHEQGALDRMATYLPKESNSSPYQDGGGLYALGLIHANHGSEEMIKYLVDQLKNARDNTVRHGACLGLGLAAMGTENREVYELLNSQLTQDDAVVGEAAGIAMGLVMMGTNHQEAINEMCQYAADTQHEKIIRGLAVGVAMIVFNRLEEADSLIENLMADKDAAIRRCGIYCIAMAYAGSGLNEALRKLLHVAVSDVSDDVRRAAVESIGFVMFRNQDQVPSIVSLLSESYNPSVRYGSAMALGIACAGTGNKDALALLEPLTDDSVAFVRQGAFVAESMILIQQTEVMQPKVSTFREKLRKTIEDKHEDAITKFGAIIGTGIIDAGGRNTVIGLSTRSGHVHAPSVVGMLVFLQFWFWYPLTHFLSLAFRPSSIICLNKNLDMPKIDIRSDAKPATFAYPDPLEEKKSKEKEKVETAVLSTTAKQLARQKNRKIKREASEMEVDGSEATPKNSATSIASTASSTAVKVKEEPMDVDEEKEAKKNAKFEILQNPCRALNQQLKVLSLPTDQTRYSPLKPLTSGGIILLRDANPEDPEDLLEAVIAGGPKPEVEEPEPEPPAPFEYIE